MDVGHAHDAELSCRILYWSAESGSRAVGATIDGIAEIRDVTRAARGALEGLAERIGDIMVLGNKVSVFGTFGAIHAKVNLRSHGSRYESDVPIIANTPPKCRYGHNYDVVAQLSDLDA